MRTTRRLLLSILINAIFFAVLGFLLNLIPFLQTKAIHSWSDASAVLLTGAGNGVVFAIVWFFIEPLMIDRNRQKRTRG